MKASSAMGLNPESEILNPETQEPQAAPPSRDDQGPVLTTAKEPHDGGDQADAGATEPSTSPKKPKRKYRTSDKVRAASPANLKQARKAYVFTPARRAASMKALEKANAAPPEKRNRFTPRRQLAWYANLCLAHLKLGAPGQRSPSHLYNGLHCRHLEHSLALAGEDKAKLEAHRERFQRAFPRAIGRNRGSCAAWRTPPGGCCGPLGCAAAGRCGRCSIACCWPSPAARRARSRSRRRPSGWRSGCW